MADFENDDIDKLFQEIISSDDMEKINSGEIEAIISGEKVSIESLLKELVFINQSLSRAVVHVGEIILNYISIENYSIDDELKEILGNVYKLTEDLDEYMIELLLDEDDILLDENEDDDNE